MSRSGQQPERLDDAPQGGLQLRPVLVAGHARQQDHVAPADAGRQQAAVVVPGPAAAASKVSFSYM